MPKIKLLPHQKESLDQLKHFNRVGLFWDMGLGKTFGGSEKALQLGNLILLVCPKSLVDGWIEHFNRNYPYLTVSDLRKKKHPTRADVFIITYDLVWRRKEYFENLINFTLMLDESSYIQNETSKRTKGILKLREKNCILLSGTPTAGRYEKLYSQIQLLGWNISKQEFWDRYIVYKNINVGVGFPIKKVLGYKNVDELKEELSNYGASFIKTEDVLELPEQNDIFIKCKVPKIYKKFKKDLVAYPKSLVTGEEVEMLGDMSLKVLLYLRQLASAYNDDKLEHFKDLIAGTEDRLIVFYNFNEELELIKSVIDRPISIVNGNTKNLDAYHKHNNSITLIQYQAGSMGLNLQEANKIIYYSPTLTAEQFLQSKKRTHRIVQKNTCFYYYLVAGIEYDIYDTLEKREDYTLKLFERNYHD